MKQIAQCFLLVVALAGCAGTDTKPVFSNTPTYPTTSILLPSGRNLIHQAGPPCTTGKRPEVGASDSERTFSEWNLRSSTEHEPLVTAHSFLSDPKYAGEFEDYYRLEDVVEVFESASSKTIVIVEDRSPTFERRAYLLLREGADGNWNSTEILLKPYLPKNTGRQGDPAFRGALSYTYPIILEITDTHLRYTTRDGPVRAAIESLPTRGG